MRKLLSLLPLLAGYGQNTIEHPAAKQPASPQAQTPTQLPAASAKPATAYTSGDRATAGPLDTLHVGRGIVLRLVPGSKHDFGPRPLPLEYAEARRLIRQHGEGRVQRVGHTLVVRPFNSPALRFTDNTYQMRKDDNEESDARCRFLGSIPGRPYWVVDSMLWERSQSFLINKVSGRITMLLGEPEISPDRKLFLATLLAMDPESGSSFLELTAITNQSITPLWTRELRN